MDLLHFTMRREEIMYKSFNYCLTLEQVSSYRMQSIALHFIYYTIICVPGVALQPHGFCARLRSSNLGQSLGRGRCVVFLCRTPLPTVTSPPTRMNRGAGTFNAWGVTQRWTSVPSRGEYKYSLSFYADGTLGSTLPYVLFKNTPLLPPKKIMTLMRK